MPEYFHFRFRGIIRVQPQQNAGIITVLITLVLLIITSVSMLHIKLVTLI